jgi:hypothetical protein
MKFRGLTATCILATGIALSGCSAANGDVCNDFNSLTEGIDARIGELASRDQWVTPETAEEWDRIADEVDRLAVRADGVVQERMLTLVEAWPRFDSLVQGTAADGFKNQWVAVARACAA